MCLAHDPVCYVAAADTQAIPNLVQFLEVLDANMHQVRFGIFLLSILFFCSIF